MERPAITINGERIEMLTPKARIWREFIKFDEERKEIASVDFIDRHCEIIARVFGVTKDEVLDNLGVDEVMPTYTDILKYLVEMLTGKIGGETKNAVDGI